MSGREICLVCQLLSKNRFDYLHNIDDYIDHLQIGWQNEAQNLLDLAINSSYMESSHAGLADL